MTLFNKNVFWKILAKKLSNFVSLPWKLDNSYCHKVCSRRYMSHVIIQSWCIIGPTDLWSCIYIYLQHYNFTIHFLILKFRLSEKHTKFEKKSSSWFVHLLSKRPNHEEDFFKLCVLLRKSEFYQNCGKIFCWSAELKPTSFCPKKDSHIKKRQTFTPYLQFFKR